MRTPSTKSVTEKPEYSKCKKRPIRIPRARDIPPIAIIFSSLSGIPSPCLLNIFTLTIRFFISFWRAKEHSSVLYLVPLHLGLFEVTRKRVLSQEVVYGWLLNIGLEIIMFAVALLQAVGILYSTAILRRALTSTSWGRDPRGSQKNIK